MTFPLVRYSPRQKLPRLVAKPAVHPRPTEPLGRSQQFWAGLQCRANAQSHLLMYSVSQHVCPGHIQFAGYGHKDKRDWMSLTSDGITVNGGAANSSSPFSHTCQVPQRSNSHPIPGLALPPKLLGQLSLNTLRPCWLFLAMISYHFLQYLTCCALSPNLC